MRLIKKYDVFLPIEELSEALEPKHLTDQHANVVKLLHEAFQLGRESEQLERAEEVSTKEGGIVQGV